MVRSISLILFLILYLMFNAVEVMNVTLLNDSKARAYDYVSQKDQKQKKGVAIALPCLIEDEKTGNLNYLVVNISSVDESVEFKKGDYVLTAPSAYFKKNFVSGVVVHNVGFSSARTECSFVKSSKK